MANGNDPANIPYIIAENGFYYVAYKEKVKDPNIIVSAKGVANGLSEEYNDGWDFGPDSYDPTSTANPPYTQTTGSAEAVNYLVSIGGGKIRLTTGIFNIGGSFDSVSNALITIPYADNGITIEIEGSGMPFFNSNNTEQVNGGTMIVPTVSAPASTSSNNFPLPPSVFAVAPSGTTANLVIFHIHDLGFMPPSNPTLSMINAYYARSFIHGNILISPVRNSSGNYIQPTNQNAMGIITTGTAKGSSSSYSYGVIDISGMYVGYYMGPMSNIGKIYLNQNYCDISGAISQHGTMIEYLGTDFSTYMIGCPAYPLINSYSTVSETFGIGGTGLTILNWEISYPPTGNWYSTTDLIVNNSTYPSRIKVLNIDIVNNSGSALPDFWSLVSSPAGYISLKIPTTQVPTLTANPPVSATVYQNTNPYDIEIDLPVYATTSGTAGYVTIAKGSTDSPTSIGNQYVSGDTSSTSTQIIRLRVPAGWYYEFTASGVTFGTASVFAD